MGLHLPGWLKAILEGGYEPQADEDKLYALAAQYDLCAKYLCETLPGRIDAAATGFGSAYHGEAGAALEGFLKRYATDANASGPAALAGDLKNVAEFLRTMGDMILRTKRELLLIGIVSVITIVAGLGPIMGTLIRKLGQEGVKALFRQLLKRLINREARKLQARMIGEMVANAAKQSAKFAFSPQMVPKVLGLVGAEVADEVIPYALAGWAGELTGHDRRLVVDGNGKPVMDGDRFVTTHDWDWRGTAMTATGAVVGVPLSHGLGKGLAKVPGLGKIGRTFANNAVTSPLASSLTAWGYGEGWHNPKLEDAWIAGAHGAVRNSTPSDVNGPLERVGEKAGEWVGNKIVSAVSGGHPPGPDGGGHVQSPPVDQGGPATSGSTATSNTTTNAPSAATSQVEQSSVTPAVAAVPTQSATTQTTSTQTTRTTDQEQAAPRRDPTKQSTRPTTPPNNNPDTPTEEEAPEAEHSTTEATQAQPQTPEAQHLTPETPQPNAPTPQATPTAQPAPHSPTPAASLTPQADPAPTNSPTSQLTQTTPPPTSTAAVTPSTPLTPTAAVTPSTPATPTTPGTPSTPATPSTPVSPGAPGGRARRVRGAGRPDDAVPEALRNAPAYQGLSESDRLRVAEAIMRVTNGDPARIEGLRPLLESPGFRELDSAQLLAEVGRWNRYEQLFGRAIELGARPAGSPETLDVSPWTSHTWDDATDLKELQPLPQKLSTSGRRGKVVTLDEHAGVYPINRNGTEWILKLFPDGEDQRLELANEFKGLVAAARTGYGPRPHGLVVATIGTKQYVGYAMGRVPGAMVHSPHPTESGAIAEVERARRAVTFDTVLQLHEYFQRLLAGNHHSHGELQPLIDPEAGNLRVIDLADVQQLLDDPEYQRLARADYGFSLESDDIRRQLIDAAVENARRAAEEDSGRARLQGTPEDRGGLNVDAVQKAVEAVRRRMRLPDGLPVKIVVGEDTEALARDHGIERSRGPRPGYFRMEGGVGVVYLAAKDHSSAEDVAASVWHEVVGHFGWKLVSPEVRAAVLAAVHELRGLDPDLSADTDELYADERPDVRDEEFFARLVEGGVPTRLRQAWNTLLCTRLGTAFAKIGAISNETLERARRDHRLEPLYKIARALVQAIREHRPTHQRPDSPRSRADRPGPNISRIRPARKNRYDGGGLAPFSTGLVESSYGDLLNGTPDEQALAAALQTGPDSPDSPDSMVKRFLVSAVDDTHFEIEGARLTPHHLAVMTDLYRNVSIALDLPAGTSPDLAQRLANIMGLDITVRTTDGWQVLHPKADATLQREGTIEFGPDDTLILRTPENPDGVLIEDLEPHLGRLLGVFGSKAAFAFYDQVVLIAHPTIEVSFFKQLSRTRDLLTKPGADQVIAPLRYTTVFERDAFVAGRFPTISRDIWASIPDLNGPQVLQPTQASLDSLLAIRAFFLANNLVITDLQFGIDPDGRFWAYDVGRVRPLPTELPTAPAGVNLDIFTRGNTDPLEIIDAWIAWAADGVPNRTAGDDTSRARRVRPDQPGVPSKIERSDFRGDGRRMPDRAAVRAAAQHAVPQIAAAVAAARGEARDVAINGDQIAVTLEDGQRLTVKLDVSGIFTDTGPVRWERTAGATDWAQITVSPQANDEVIGRAIAHAVAGVLSAYRGESEADQMRAGRRAEVGYLVDRLEQDPHQSRKELRRVLQQLNQLEGRHLGVPPLPRGLRQRVQNVLPRNTVRAWLADEIDQLEHRLTEPRLSRPTRLPNIGPTQSHAPDPAADRFVHRLFQHFADQPTATSGLSASQQAVLRELPLFRQFVNWHGPELAAAFGRMTADTFAQQIAAADQQSVADAFAKLRSLLDQRDNGHSWFQRSTATRQFAELADALGVVAHDNLRSALPHDLASAVANLEPSLAQRIRGRIGLAAMVLTGIELDQNRATIPQLKARLADLEAERQRLLQQYDAGTPTELHQLTDVLVRISTTFTQYADALDKAGIDPHTRPDGPEGRPVSASILHNDPIHTRNLTDLTWAPGRHHEPSVEAENAALIAAKIHQATNDRYGPFSLAQIQSHAATGRGLLDIAADIVTAEEHRRTPSRALAARVDFHRSLTADLARAVPTSLFQPARPPLDWPTYAELRPSALQQQQTGLTTRAAARTESAAKAEADAAAMDDDAKAKDELAKAARHNAIAAACTNAAQQADQARQAWQAYRVNPTPATLQAARKQDDLYEQRRAESLPPKDVLQTAAVSGQLPHLTALTNQLNEALAQQNKTFRFTPELLHRTLRAETRRLLSPSGLILTVGNDPRADVTELTQFELTLDPSELQEVLDNPVVIEEVQLGQLVQGGYSVGTTATQSFGVTGGLKLAPVLSALPDTNPLRLAALVSPRIEYSKNVGLSVTGGATEYGLPGAVEVIHGEIHRFRSSRPSWSWRMRTSAVDSWSARRVVAGGTTEDTATLELGISHAYAVGAPKDTVTIPSAQRRTDLPEHVATRVDGLSELADEAIAGLRQRLGSLDRIGHDQLCGLLTEDAPGRLAETTRPGGLTRIITSGGRVVAYAQLETDAVWEQATLLGDSSKDHKVERLRVGFSGTSGGQTFSAADSYSVSAGYNGTATQDLGTSSWDFGPGGKAGLNTGHDTSSNTGDTAIHPSVQRMQPTVGVKLRLKHTLTIHRVHRVGEFSLTTAGDAVLRMPENDAFRYGLPVPSAAIVRDQDGQPRYDEDGRQLLRGDPQPTDEDIQLPVWMHRGFRDGSSQKQEGALPIRGAGPALVQELSGADEALQEFLEHLSAKGLIPNGELGGKDPALAASQLANLERVGQQLARHRLETGYDPAAQEGIVLRLDRHRTGFPPKQYTYRIRLRSYTGEARFLGLSTGETVVNLDIGSNTTSRSGGSSRGLPWQAKFGFGDKPNEGQEGSTPEITPNYGRSSFGRLISWATGSTVNRVSLTESTAPVAVFDVPHTIVITEVGQESNPIVTVDGSARLSIDSELCRRDDTEPTLSIEGEVDPFLLCSATFQAVDVGDLVGRLTAKLPELARGDSSALHHLSAFLNPRNLAARPELLTAPYRTSLLVTPAPSNLDQALTQRGVTTGRARLAVTTTLLNLRYVGSGHPVNGEINLTLGSSTLTTGTSAGGTKGLGGGDGAVATDGSSYGGSLSGSRSKDRSASSTETQIGGIERLAIRDGEHYQFWADLGVVAELQAIGAEPRAAEVRSGAVMLTLPERDALRLYGLRKLDLPAEKVNDAVERLLKGELHLPPRTVQALGRRQTDASQRERLAALLQETVARLRTNWWLDRIQQHRLGLVSLLDSVMPTAEELIERGTPGRLPDYYDTTMGAALIDEMSLQDPDGNETDLYREALAAVEDDAPEALDDPVLASGLRGDLAGRRGHGHIDNLLSESGFVTEYPTGDGRQERVRIKLEYVGRVMIDSAPDAGGKENVSGILHTYDFREVGRSVTVGTTYNPQVGGALSGGGSGTAGVGTDLGTSTTASSTEQNTRMTRALRNQTMRVTRGFRMTVQVNESEPRNLTGEMTLLVPASVVNAPTPQAADQGKVTLPRGTVVEGTVARKLFKTVYGRLGKPDMLTEEGARVHRTALENMLSAATRLAAFERIASPEGHTMVQLPVPGRRSRLVAVQVRAKLSNLQLVAEGDAQLGQIDRQQRITQLTTKSNRVLPAARSLSGSNPAGIQAGLSNGEQVGEKASDGTGNRNETTMNERGQVVTVKVDVDYHLRYEVRRPDRHGGFQVAATDTGSTRGTAYLTMFRHEYDALRGKPSTPPPPTVAEGNPHTSGSIPPPSPSGAS